MYHCSIRFLVLNFDVIVQDCNMLQFKLMHAVCCSSLHIILFVLCIGNFVLFIGYWKMKRFRIHFICCHCLKCC